MWTGRRTAGAEEVTTAAAAVVAAGETLAEMNRSGKGTWGVTVMTVVIETETIAVETVGTGIAVKTERAEDHLLVTLKKVSKRNY